MFTKITLKNFRSFEYIEFDLTKKANQAKPLVIVYGENGAGKSNLLSAFVLLKELMQTLDVRERYEQLLAREAVFSDEAMENSLRQKWLDDLRDIKAIIKDYKTIGCDAPTIAKFEFSIGENSGEYYVELCEEEILHERLEYLITKRRGVHFDCSPEKIQISSGVTGNKAFLSDLKATASRFWGKHSMLAIIRHEINDKSKSFGYNNLSESFFDVLGEFNLLSCSLGLGDRYWESIEPPNDVFKAPEKGRITKDLEESLDQAENLFSEFFSSVNPDVLKAYYKKSYGERYINYELYFERMIAGKIKDIPFSQESTGNQQLLQSFCYLLCACMGATVVLDEADSGIHDVLFRDIIQDVQPCIEGQLIMSTHNTLLMDADYARDAVYIIQEAGEGYRNIKCVNAYDKRTYLNSKVRNRYMHKDYEGLPRNKKIDISSMTEIIFDLLKRRAT